MVEFIQLRIIPLSLTASLQNLDLHLHTFVQLQSLVHGTYTCNVSKILHYQYNYCAGTCPRFILASESHRQDVIIVVIIIIVIIIPFGLVAQKSVTVLAQTTTQITEINTQHNATVKTILCAI